MTTPAPTTLDPDEVQVGTANGPGLYISPVGTPPPADTAAAWDAPWAVLGYVDESGPTLAQNTTKEDITPWQSRAPIRAVLTERGLTARFIMWQLNATTLALFFDNDVPTAGTDGALAFDVRTDESQHLYAFGLDAMDNERALRIVFPRATLSDSGDMTLTKGTAVPLDVTLAALEDNGVLAHVMLGPATASGATRSAMAADLSSGARAARQREPAGASS